MSPFLRILLTVLLLAGRTPAHRQSTAVEAPASAYVGKGKCPVSRADVAAAVAAAQPSKYFPGGQIYLAMVISKRQIEVMYGDVAGIFVIVRRIDGRWQAVGIGGWNS